jgi:hypothetical protein
MQKQVKNTELIGKFVSRKGYTDLYIVGQVIGVYGKTGIIIQEMKAVRNTVKMNYVAGGFSAICLNNSDQRWEFETLESTIKDRVSKAFFKIFVISDEPRHHYDYNF